MLLAPRAAWFRRRLGPDPDPYAVSILELHRYRRSICAFMVTTAANPDVLTDADLDATSVVLDVGAFVGEWAEKIRQRYGSTVYAFEPNPGAFAELGRRVGDDPGIIRLPYALATVDGTASLATDAGPGATLFHDDEGARVSVELRDVVTVLDELGLDHVDLMKVNIEGGEYDLLERMIDEDLLARVRVVSVQFHPWIPDAHRRRRRIRKAMARTHEETWCYPWIWELWTRRT